MLEGLAYLHQKDIVHRDLKCADILVDNKGTIKLSDFGASKIIVEEELTNPQSFMYATTSQVSSSSWMAPEVLNKQILGKPSDIWSIGCCVVEMLNSKPPWSELKNNEQ